MINTFPHYFATKKRLIPQIVAYLTHNLRRKVLRICLFYFKNKQRKFSWILMIYSTYIIIIQWNEIIIMDHIPFICSGIISRYNLNQNYSFYLQSTLRAHLYNDRRQHVTIRPKMQHHILYDVAIFIYKIFHSCREIGHI